MSPVQSEYKLGGNSVMHAWIAKDPKGKLVQKSIGANRDEVWAAVQALTNSIGSWDYATSKLRKLGWRVVKVELRGVKP